MAAVTEDLTAIVHLAAFKIPRYGKAIDTLKINYRGTESRARLRARSRLQDRAGVHLGRIWPQSQGAVQRSGAATA